MASYIEAMATFKVVLVLLTALNAASAQKSLLTKLYAKAAEENRPLVLVLDSNLKDRDNDKSYIMGDQLDRLEQNAQSSRNVNSVKNSRNHSTNSKFLEDLLERLQSAREVLNKNKNRNNGERLNKGRYGIVENKGNNKVNIESLRDKINTEYNRDRRNKNRARTNKVRNSRDDEFTRYSNVEDRNIGGNQKVREISFKKMNKIDYIRPSVLRNLLRISNDLNCDAKDECEDECGTKYSGKKKNTCTKICEVKYVCEEEEKGEEEEESDNDCGDSCEDSLETIETSTKGVIDEDYTKECTRC